MAISDIEEVFKKVGVTYQKMLNTFRPCRPGGEFLEQNLITLFCHEFLNYFGSKACAYTEIPFMGDSDSDAWQARLDGFLVESENGYVLEAKGSLSADSLFSAISSDVKRINSRSLGRSLSEMFRGNREPRRIYGLVIADCWRNEKKLDDSAQAERWVSDDIVVNYPHLGNLNRRMMQLGAYDGYQHYLLYGWSDALNFDGDDKM